MSVDVLAGGWAKVLGGDRKQFNMFIEKMIDGFAYHKIVVDKEGKPVDYVFLEINHAFEKMTGLKREHIIGKKVTEVLVGIEKDPADWIGVYGHVALTGEPVEFENHAKPLDKWYRVSAYCPEKGYFVALFEDITERKSAEKDIERSNQKISEILGSIQEAFYVLDHDWNIVYINSIAAGTVGLPKDLIGKNFWEMFPKLRGTIVEENYRASMENSEIKHFESHGHYSDPWYEITVFPSAEGITILGTNITQRKKDEEALRELNRHLKAVSDSNQALMRATDESKFTQEVCDIIINDCGYALTWVGLAEHDKDKTVRPVAFTGFDKGYIDALRVTWDGKSERGRGPTGTVIRSGKPYICKNMQFDPNFEPWRPEALKRGYTASLVLPLTSFEGDTFGALNIYSKESEPFTDEEIKLLTELSNDFSYGIGMLRLRKKKELDEETLRKQASLIDLSPDAIIVRKFEGIITFWSKGAEKLYGWTKDEAIGQVTHKLLMTEFPIPLKEIEKILKLEGKWSGELVHTCKNGDKVVVQSYQLVKFGADGKIFEMLESNVDITQRTELQAQLEESAIRVEEYANQMEELANKRAAQLKDAERLAAIGATAGMVGHDIRNPLQAITGDLYLAKTELASVPDGDEKKNTLESLEEIEKNVDYINKIVADLQDYARPLNPRAQETNIKSLFNEVLAKNGIPKNVKCTVIVEDKAGKVLADPDYLRRIAANLTLNAVQAMPDGGQLTIRAYTGKQTNDVVITVKDTGVGIPEGIKPKLFTPMMTTKSKGQGFGLAVVKRMTEGLGGTVTFESTEGKGTTFIVRLPRPKT